MAELQSVEIQIEDTQSEDNQTHESVIDEAQGEEMDDEEEDSQSEEGSKDDGENEQAKEDKRTKSEKVKGYLLGIKRYTWNATFGLLFFFITFLILFAFIMMVIERPNEMERNMQIAERRANITNYTQLREEVLYLLTDPIASKLTMNDAMVLLNNLEAAANDTELETNDWDYIGSLFFMLTVLTTIGMLANTCIMQDTQGLNMYT